ncbi:MAG: Ig-like domain-containing protein, partial [bacterium]|nr:Ig-like domain-containing protein [bacterium]
TDGIATSEIVMVEITVEAVNDAPVGNNDVYEVDEDGVLTVMADTGVLVNDSDPEGDALTASLVDGPSNGVLELNADGSFTYTPDPDFHGTDAFTYTAGDGALSSELIAVEITVNPVNDAPVAVGESYSVLEDETLEVMTPGLLENDSDVDGDALEVVLETGPENGSLELNADGSFSYTPAENFAGMDAFSYRVTDGIATSEIVMVEITVEAVNDAPVGNNDVYEVDEDGVLTVMADTGVLVNDSDPDGDALTASLVDGPSNGVLELNEDGSFTYTPDPDFHGTDAFTYTAGDGALNSELIAVEITVNPVNDAPLAMGESYSVLEDESLEVLQPGLLGNDSDPDGDALEVVLDTPPSNGQLELNADGSFTYTPAANFSGSDSFSYRVSDGVAVSEIVTAEIIVESKNDRPRVGNDFYTVMEDNILEVALPGILANDTDADGDILLPMLIDLPDHGVVELSADGSFIYTPNENFNGTDAFTYLVSDGTVNSDLGVVEIDVTSVNDAPQAVDDSYETELNTALVVETPGVLSNDSDVDGDSLTVVVDTLPQNGTLVLAEDGSFVYTPAEGFEGVDSFTYSVSDGMESSLAMVSIVVNPGEAPPQAVNDSYQAISGETLVVDADAGILANDFDPNGDPLEAILFRGPKYGDLVLNADGSFSYTPNPEYSGIDSFIYRVSDGSLQSSLAVVTLNLVAAEEDSNDDDSDDDSSNFAFSNFTGGMGGMIGFFDPDALADELSSLLSSMAADAFFSEITAGDDLEEGRHCIAP